MRSLRCANAYSESLKDNCRLMNNPKLHQITTDIQYYDMMIHWQMMIWCLIKTRDNPWLISHMQSAKSDNGYFSMKGNTHTMCIACNLLGSFSLKGFCSSTIIKLKIWFLDWLLKLIFCQAAAALKFRSTMFSFISCLLSLKKWK